MNYKYKLQPRPLFHNPVPQSYSTILFHNPIPQSREP